MARRYRYAFAKKREAAKGKWSVGLAAASLVLFIVAVVLALFLDGKLGGLIGGTGLFAMLLSAYGFALGLSSFSEENRKHRTSMIGSILNGVILVIWLGLFLSGVQRMEEKERLKKQLDFILEVDKVKNIFRQTYLADGNRKENDAEHSWHLALMAVLLKEYSNEEVDLSKVIPMVLAHDLVEIDAGDTYAYDEKGAATKDARERKAADRIYGLLPEDQGQWLKALWEEFEAYETPEAKFAHVLDNCQPLFLNDASNGRSWEEHQVKKSQIYKRNRKTGEGSEVIWEYMKELIDKHIAMGHVIDDEKDGR